MPDSEGLAHVHVDFNEMDLDGRFFVLPEDAGGRLPLNAQVILEDAEGNSARGTVVELMGQGRAMIAMLAGTWHRREAVAVSPAEHRTFQDQISGLLAPYLRGAASLTGLYRLSEVPSSVAAQTAAPSSGLPQSQGAVLSSL